MFKLSLISSAVLLVAFAALVSAQDDSTTTGSPLGDATNNINVNPNANAPFSNNSNAAAIDAETARAVEDEAERNILNEATKPGVISQILSLLKNLVLEILAAIQAGSASVQGFLKVVYHKLPFVGPENPPEQAIPEGAQGPNGN